MTGAALRPELDSGAVVAGLAALAQETRLAVFRLLVQRGRSGETAGEIARQLGVPPQTLSFHLKEMAHAGLLEQRRVGRNIYCAIDFEHVRRLAGYLVGSCCAGESESEEEP